MAKISLTNHQTSIWLEAQIQKGTPIFNIGTFVELNGLPNKVLLEKSIQEVISQNDALRIRLIQHPTSAKQKFGRNSDFNLGFKSFNDGPNSRELALNWMNEEFTVPMKLDRQKLYEIYLVVVNDNSSFLFFKHHHIYIDGWSRALLVKKIAQQYNAMISGIPVKSASSFADYCAKKEEMAIAQNKQESLNFWKEQFGDFQRESLFDRKDKLKSNLPSRRKQMALSRNLFDGVKFPDLEGEKSKFYFFIASLYVTLSKERGQKEIVFGIPLLNRFGEEEKNTIGYFVGLLPLKLSFESNVSFVQMVNDIRAEMAKSLPYRDLAIHEINRALGVNFTNSTQLYDVVFSFEIHNHDSSFGNIDVVEAGTFSSNYEQNPLVIHVQDYIKDTGVHFEFDYNLNYLSGLEVDNLIKRYKHVIDAFSNNVHAKVESVNVLFPNEFTTLEEYASGVKKKVSSHSLVDQIFTACDQDETKIIVRDDFGGLSFGELRAEAEKIARHLIDLGLEKNEAIGVMVPREKESVVSILAVLISGASYVPIDPALSVERIEAMLADSAAKKLICHADFINEGQFDKLELIHPKQIDTVSDAQFPSLDPTSRAYILFTSGSTGRPKGVIVNHGNVSNLIEALNDEIYSKYNTDTVLALLSSFNFDASIQQLFAALILGRELVIVPSAVRQDGKLLVDFLVSEGIGICDGIPTHLLSMVTRTSSLNERSALKHFIIGGESFSVDLAKRLFNWLGKLEVKVSNVYGPTECTVDSTIYTFDAQTFSVDGQIPIGHPINNTSIWILDESDQILPPGAIGEICIAGEGLSSAYSNDSALTQEKFKHHLQLNKRLYHTGDFGKWNTAGLLLFKGRKDNQVKIRGYRIELGEIEFCLNKLVEIEQAVVLVHESGSQKRLIGFVQTQIKINEDAIKDRLSNDLPSYMIPHFIVPLESLPLTITGKIDRKKLLNINIENSKGELNLPNSETEKQLSAIFCEVLELKVVDIKGGFFSLGGDSMSLMFLLVRIEEELGISISMSDFGSMNSVKLLANYIDSSGEIERKTVSLENEIYDLSELQKLNNLNLENELSSALITGATGFVGAFLCSEASKKFESVSCIVRSGNKDAAKERLARSFSKYGLGTPDWNRVEVILGDLAKDQLGLNDTDWERITGVDYIYHSGAEVNFVKDFDSLKKANVYSTYNLLKICKLGKKKSFNFISTKGVFGDFSEDLSEDASLENEIHYVNKGYESSKWVSDVMTTRSRAIGIESNVYRLGRIAGDSVKGIGRHEDFFHRFIEGCIEIEFFPIELLTVSTDLTPVDMTVESIIELSLVSSSSNFHLLNNKLTSYEGMVKACAAQGIDLKLISYDNWFEKVEELNQMNENNPFFLITPILKQKEWFSEEKNGFGGAITSSKIENIGIEWPEADVLWHKYVGNCINRKRKINTD